MLAHTVAASLWGSDPSDHQIDTSYALAELCINVRCLLLATVVAHSDPAKKRGNSFIDDLPLNAWLSDVQRTYVR